MIEAIGAHWVEYVIEGLLLGAFMVIACATVTALHHPASRLAKIVRSSHLRRAIAGIVMGLTAVMMIYSPLGERSGAHLNPGTTLTFFVLSKLGAWDAGFYVIAQFIGAAGGVGVSWLVLRRAVAHDRVTFAATEPGRFGIGAAWIGEFAISFGMMFMVLWTANRAALAPYTGLLGGTLLAFFIVAEAPLSGASMNPARTLGSAIFARAWRGIWVYFTAPPLGMLIAAGAYASVEPDRVFCAKTHHGAVGAPCIFHCRIREMPGWER